MAKMMSEEITFLIHDRRLYGHYVVERCERSDAEYIGMSDGDYLVGRWPNGKAFCRLARLHEDFIIDA